MSWILSSNGDFAFHKANNIDDEVGLVPRSPEDEQSIYVDVTHGDTHDRDYQHTIVNIPTEVIASLLRSVGYTVTKA